MGLYCESACLTGFLRLGHYIYLYMSGIGLCVYQSVLQFVTLLSLYKCEDGRCGLTSTGSYFLLSSLNA